MNNKGFLICKASFWGWVLILIFAGSCSTVQISERGTNQNSPGITSREVSRGNKLVSEGVNISNSGIPVGLSKSNSHSVFGQENPSKKYVNENYRLENTDKDSSLKSEIHHTSKSEIGINKIKHSYGKTANRSFTSILIDKAKKNVSITSAIRTNLTPEKVGGFQKIETVVPDYDSPIGKWIVFVSGVFVAAILLGLFIYSTVAFGFSDFIEAVLVITLGIALVSVFLGLVFLASHGFDDVEDHSIIYQIGFYLTAFSVFTGFISLLIGLPLMIFGAVYENWW